MTNEIGFPATVAAYFSDPAVRNAVEALLEVDCDSLPMGLEGEELDTYFRARGGAELVKYDMAHVLYKLWTTIWGELIGPHWVAAPFDELVNEEFAVTADQIWREKSFTVYHRAKPYILYTDVHIESHALYIAFSIENEEKDEVLLQEDFLPFRWRADDKWAGWQVMAVKITSRGALPELSPLLEAAQAAYSAVEKSVSAQIPV